MSFYVISLLLSNTKASFLLVQSLDRKGVWQARLTAVTWPLPLSGGTEVLSVSVAKGNSCLPYISQCPWRCGPSLISTATTAGHKEPWWGSACLLGGQWRVTIPGSWTGQEGVVGFKEQGTRWVQRISPAALLVQITCQHHMPEFI